jgi:4-hydroxy-tetrahydrodipicolinate reductase
MATARHGEATRPKRGRIDFSSARDGEVTRKNSVFFAGAGERLDIISRVTDYRAFARGTLDAAIWIAGQRHAGQGMQRVDAIREVRVTEQTYYRHFPPSPGCSFTRAP